MKGIIQDLKGRKAVYGDDWSNAFAAGPRIFAPIAYIFFASALPVIAFGEQLSRETDGSLSTVETLASTALCGIIHSLIGGQPLLVVGVAEPTVIMYSYLYTFALSSDSVGKKLYLAWAGWVCVWTALLLILLAVFDACNILNKFTRLAGETFGMLIAVLFFQEAIKGMVGEFSPLENEDEKSPDSSFQWIYVNGLLGVIFTFGVLITALKSRKARSWEYGTGWFRGIIADYGVPLVVMIWAAMSLTVPSQVPEGVPRRLQTPLPWDPASMGHWTVFMIPTSVLWGYFAYMAIDSLPGNQFWERLVMLLITPTRRHKILERPHASFVETVPFKQIAKFTIFQLLYFLICFGVTWIPVAGILFPLPFFFLISIREKILPKFFQPLHLKELDGVEYEEIEGDPLRTRSISLRRNSLREEFDSQDAEAFDELTTGRGELRMRTASVSQEKSNQVYPADFLGS